jgi:PAS domain S-box-containing protein
MSTDETEPSGMPWQQVVNDLRSQLAEAEEILQAIAQHKVDAFIINGPEEEQVYTLRGADHAYQVILEAINEGAATLGVDGTIYYCNPAFAALLQMPLEKLIGTTLDRYISDENLPLYSSLLEQGIAERSKGEVLLRTASGTAVPVLLSCSSLQLDEVPGICLVATNLTEQKRQAELIAAEQLTHSILEQASAAMVVCDADGQIIRANRQAHQLCRRNPILRQFDEVFQLRRNISGEAIFADSAHSLSDPVQVSDLYTPFSFAADMCNQVVQNEEAVFIQPGDKLCYLVVNCAPLTNAGKQPLGSVVTLVDITVHKEMEATLRQARDELELRVIERTRELIESNLRLQQEIEERKHAEAALTEVRRRLSQSQETERLLLARELHDGPLQEVIGMAFDLLLLTQTLQEEEQVAKVTEISNAVQKTARHLRLVAQTLRPPLLAHLGLAAALRAHLKQIQDVRETPILSLETSEEKWPVSEEVALALLRIGQQSLQNALQHAQAEHIQVRLHYDDRWLQLEIKDDGRGFVVPTHQVELAREGHLGIVGMAERAEAIGGKFEILSQPGQGTCVRVTVPKEV